MEEMGIDQQDKVNLINPSGDIVSMPTSMAQKALSQGYEQANPEQVKEFFNEQKYGGAGEQAKTFLEGAGVGSTLGLSTGAERLAGVNPEDISARRETNPLTHAFGEAVGFIGSMFVPVLGEANLLEKAGAGIAAKLIPEGAQVINAAKALNAAREAGVGIKEAEVALKTAKEAEPWIVKAGTMAANQAVQGALMQSGDEVSKMLASDPNQSFETALTDVGLSSVLGGAFGAGFGVVHPLWESSVSNKLDGFLSKFRNRINGETIPIGQEFETVLKDAPAELRAGLSEDPLAKKYYQELIESGTSSGDALRETRDKLIADTQDRITSIFKQEEGLTAHEAGESAKGAILSKLDQMNAEIKSKYDQVADTSGIPISDDAKLKFHDVLKKRGKEFGSRGGPSEAKFIEYADRMLDQENVGQLDKLITEVGSDYAVAKRAGDSEKARAIAEARDSLRTFQEQQIEKKTMQIAKSAQDEDIMYAGYEAIIQKQEARDTYKKFIKDIGDIASAGKIGKVRTFGQIQEALEKIPSAKLADKLFDKKNIEALNYLKKEYPDVFDTIIKQKKAEILESATKTGELQHNKILNSVNGLPKEVKNLMFSKEEQDLINANARLIREANKRINTSGTARGIDALWKHLPAGVGAGASVLTGHNPLVGFLLGEAAQILGRNVPDAIKLSLLKFLGSSGPIDSGAFKAMVDYAEKVAAGQRAIAKSVKNVIAPTAAGITNIVGPKQSERDKLDKRLKEAQEKQDSMFDVGGKIPYYLPEHGTAIAATTINAVNYLNSLRPKQEKMSPLDSVIKPNPVQKSVFNRALDIAEKPLITMKSMAEGTLTTRDVITLKTIYPALHQNISNHLVDAVMNASEKGQHIPYKQRMGISMFLGMPIDSTFTPQFIASNQPMAQNQSPQSPMTSQEKTKHSMTSLGKASGLYETSQQNREKRHAL